MCYYSNNLDLARTNANDQIAGRPWTHLEPVYCKSGCIENLEEYREWVKVIQGLVAKDKLPIYLNELPKTN